MKLNNFCKDLKIIYFHISRTAGKSIEDKLFKWDGQQTLPSNHLSPSDVLRLNCVTKEQFNECFKFTFVRN